MAREHRPVVVIPTYDNPVTIEGVTTAVRERGLDVVVVNDGSGPSARGVLRRLEQRGVPVLHRAANGGKGAAVKTGLRWALEAGYTHGLQVDADGQHALEDLPRLLGASRAQPDALVLSVPQYDETAPRVRRLARWVAIFWVRVATLLDAGRITDPMCGYRVYPLAATVPLLEGAGDRMDFDPEIAVRLVWSGASVVEVPTRVRYFSPEEGGVSHYRAVTDNVLVSVMYARLCILRYTGLWRLL